MRPSRFLALALLAAPSTALATGFGPDDFGWMIAWPYQDDRMVIGYGDTEPAACGDAAQLVFDIQAQRPQLDVIAVVDRSGSINDEEWSTAVLPKVEQLARELSREDGWTRMGIVSFGSTARVEHSLAEPQTFDALSASIGSMTRGGTTNMSAGIYTALDEFEAHGDPTRARVVVLVTDGAPNWPERDFSVCDTEPAALEAAGVATYLVGVGSGFNASAVSCLLESPADMWTPDSYASIDWLAVISRFEGISDFSLSLDLDDTVASYGPAVAEAGTVRFDGDQLFWEVDKISTTWGAFLVGGFNGFTLTIPFRQNPDVASGGATGLIEAASFSYLAYGATVPVTGELALDRMQVTLPTCSVAPTDTDGDGWPDDEDAFPRDPTEWADADTDGVGDNTDVCPGGDDGLDADNDGAPDACDVCPVDFFNDSDGDGACDSADPCVFDPDDDADGDGVCADEDLCPLDPLDDLDADGICGDVDRCPEDAANDADGDGVCGNVDACAGGDDTLDADGDGTADACDTCPADPANDADGDGWCADEDPCPLDPLDDLDGDGVCGDVDPCPNDFADDSDGDAICDSVDPCPYDLANDADGDGICEIDDLCPTTADPIQGDADGDGIGDACEPDNDGDGIIDDLDRCPFVADPDQADTDADGFGDACDADDDGDGVNDAIDLCAGTPTGEPVLANGCSIDQVAPCDAAWKNHGAYVSAVSRASETLARAGTISWEERDEVVSAAAQSTCGRR